jgi:apolipoprotein N-acyltransferase
LKLFRKNKPVLTPEEKLINKKHRFYLLISGALLGLSFPPMPVPQIMFFALVPYLYVIERKEKLIEINRATYLAAFVFGLLTIYWVGSWQSTADPFLMISGVLLVFINPVFFLIPSTIYYFCRKSINKTTALFLLPLFWVTYEYAYMLTDASFPWLTLGNGLVKFLSFIQVADIIGALGLSALVIYINIFLYRAFLSLKAERKKFLINLAAAILLIIMPVIYGLVRVSSFEFSKDKVRVGLIQPNLDPWDKWAGGNLDDIARLHFDLSQKAIDEGAEIIFWPETAFPVYLFSGSHSAEVDAIYNFIRKNNTYLVTGMPDVRFYPSQAKKGDGIVPPDAKYAEAGDYYYATYNAVFLISPDSYHIQKYGKMKLVPFGERVPFVETVPFLGNLIKWGVGISGWNVGRDTINFTIPAGHFRNLTQKDSLHINSLVCYESIYPYFVSHFIQRNAEMIAVVTNDSWYGKLSGPYQHKEYAVLRAIENRRSVVRAANGGISCIINPVGITEVETGMFEQAFIAGDVTIQRDKTFFTQYPLVIPVLSSAVSLWVIGIFVLKKLKLKMKIFM